MYKFFHGEERIKNIQCGNFIAKKKKLLRPSKAVLFKFIKKLSPEIRWKTIQANDRIVEKLSKLEGFSSEKTFPAQKENRPILPVGG